MRRLLGMLAIAGLLLFGGGTAHAAEQYTWRNPASNLCMEAAEPLNFGKVAAISAPCNAGPPQRWFRTDVSDGYWMAESRQYPGKCLRNADGTQPNTVYVVLAPCDKNDPMLHWRFIQNGGSTWLWQTRQYSGKCLSVPGINSILSTRPCDVTDPTLLWAGSLWG